mgnify:FL=1
MDPAGPVHSRLLLVGLYKMPSGLLAEVGSWPIWQTAVLSIGAQLLVVTRPGWLGLELKLPPPPPEEVRHLTSPDQVEATTARSRKAAEKLTRASWRSGGAVGTEERAAAAAATTLVKKENRPSNPNVPPVTFLLINQEDNCVS